MRAKGIEFDKVIAGHGSPFPFLRKDRAIVRWVSRQ
jgi:hypothetical protein